MCHSITATGHTPTPQHTHTHKHHTLQGAECVVMAGDPCQLPPTITSREAAQVHGLATTLFERLQRQAGIETLLLDTQYRMHPAIAQFPRWAEPESGNRVATLCACLLAGCVCAARRAV
jgi:hypothetical protein